MPRTLARRAQMPRLQERRQAATYLGERHWARTEKRPEMPQVQGETLMNDARHKLLVSNILGERTRESSHSVCKQKGIWLMEGVIGVDEWINEG